MLLSNHEEDVSGNLIPLYFTKPSPSPQANGVLRTHPSDQYPEFQSFEDFGTNPFKHAHFGELPLLLQLENGPHKA
mgnify:CR=1 FL=1